MAENLYPIYVDGVRTLVTYDDYRAYTQNDYQDQLKIILQLGLIKDSVHLGVLKETI